MKTNLKSFLGYAFSTIVFSLFISSCSKKDSSADTGTDQPTAISLTMASSLTETLYDDVFNQINLEAENSGISERLTGVQGCATVTLSPADLTTFPKTMTIDYGGGCAIGPITRKGKLIVNLSGRIKNPGSTLGVSFENYSVNNYKLEGSFSITNNTANNILSFTTQTTNGKLTYPAGLVYTHTGSHTLTQIGGTSTATFIDDSWSVIGSGSTTSSANENLTVTIKTPLVKSVACGSVVSGEENFQYNNISGSLNFGEGACDRLATLKIGSYTAIVNF